jgi:hypothetical protein
MAMFGELFGYINLKYGKLKTYYGYLYKISEGAKI